ncbi:MAG TPA: FKBP-type peptidyl-prolyl cis-trans isomerase [Lacibacter sp.]|nr:FKBP-type peptidyl-prolyl cis-trans isomerase [Lacibacter sp.]HMO89613.1 FKBP-type peptidyl-prolyl cis-trans isomerase [Lacibacter sp.]HMP88259.1 FKBP-type peptidyl-prolyl cis-trans isomerase [Lacibacter sp.]
MRTVTTTFLALLLTGAAVAQAPKKPVTPSTQKPTPVPVKPVLVKPVLQSGLDSLSYAIGLNIGANMRMQGIDSISQAALNRGLRDALKEQKPLMDENTANMTIQQKLQEFMMKKVNVQKEEGRRFLEENKKQPGVVVLPNGIQYKIITQGSGVKPLLEDTIKVHYKGTTIDGNVFDDSYSRGEPIEFPLGNLIEGWKQALVLMPVGSRWQIFLPSEFGYGDRGAGANIPGGAALIFELELLDVKPAKKD